MTQAAPASRPSRTYSVDFRPSRDGLPFPNIWPKGARLRIRKRAIGRVSGGLCGGMCHFSRERWLDREPIPVTARPNNPAFVDQLVAAQLASLDLPSGPWRYLSLQLPPRVIARRRSTARALAAIRADLGAGRPSCVGLIRDLSWNPAALSQHHVVLAYSTQEEPDHTTLSVYDPNSPGNDRVRLIIAADSTIRSNQLSPQPCALLAF